MAWRVSGGRGARFSAPWLCRVASVAGGPPPPRPRPPLRLCLPFATPFACVPRSHPDADPLPSPLLQHTQLASAFAAAPAAVATTAWRARPAAARGLTSSSSPRATDLSTEIEHATGLER